MKKFKVLFLLLFITATQQISAMQLFVVRFFSASGPAAHISHHTSKKLEKEKDIIFQNAQAFIREIPNVDHSPSMYDAILEGNITIDEINYYTRKIAESKIPKIPIQTATTLTREEALEKIKACSLRFIDQEDTRPLKDHVADVAQYVKFLDREKDAPFIEAFEIIRKNQNASGYLGTLSLISKLSKFEQSQFPCHEEILYKSKAEIFSKVTFRMNQD